MQYEIFGPLQIERKPDNNLVDKKRLAEFWKNLEKDHPGLPMACGCYIFVTKASKGFKPWYVGKANKSFKQECFSEQKLNHYNDVLATIASKNGKGDPKLFLVARKTEGGKFTSSSKDEKGHSDVNFLENYLIAEALRKNPKIRNTKGTKFLSEIRVPGFLNSGKGKLSEPSKALKLALKTTGR